MGTPSLDKVPHLLKLPREDARFHQDTISDLLHRRDTKFPGAQPVSFARRHLKELERADYFLAEKTDGIRLLLYLTQTHGPDGRPQEAQFLIDRKNEYYYIESGYLHIPLPVPPSAAHPKGHYDVQSWHHNTLLDGELVLQRWPNGQRQLTYIIFDILVLGGQNITDRDYGYRMGKIHTVISAHEKFAKDFPEDRRAQPFQLAAKKPSFSYAAPEMFRNILPKLPHGNDGLIFTCKDTPYVSGTDQHILKWKPPHENTVDFKMQLGPFPMEEDDEGKYEDFDQMPEIELLVLHGGNDNYQYFAHLHLTEKEWEAMKAKSEQYDHRIIECWREKDTGNWRPKIDDDGTPRFRDDKEHANHISVVQSVLQSIEDAVSEQDLIDAYTAIRTAWKARAEEQEMRDAKMKSQQQQPPHSRNSMGEASGRSQPRADAGRDEEDDGPGYAD
ncbi:Putative mRNA capping enzyme, adenylation domain, nucleic acid-binding protein [Septoria linicola]|uniref:mRNA-capping enzyme subunit alpha n=1 Tax=Septoria linicola TaxID=215465 RepID=A0A9Q9EJY5_9PEZI|nr:putative mRNA capping enzyme, adenylation domain, nucleic acid-binding protein [Septoria linicola]USW52682.1 Putative mRNA capping enzyme, adenylation domain, nucleic acid-binding protein [Septoria linicola]